MNTTTTPDTLDPTVRTLLHDIQRVSDALRLLKQKCGEGNTSTNSRALGSPLGGLDSYSLREILDRLFGESDGGTSLSNWADACDHAPFKLYKNYRENIVELNAKFPSREQRERCAAAYDLAGLLSPTPEDGEVSMFAHERPIVMVRRELLPLPSQRTLEQCGGDVGSGVRRDPFLRLLDERLTDKPSTPEDCAAWAAGRAFPALAKDALLCYLLHYLTTTSLTRQRNRASDGTSSSSGSGGSSSSNSSSSSSSTEFNLMEVPLWHSKLGEDTHHQSEGGGGEKTLVEPRPIITTRPLMDCVFWLGEAYGAPLPPNSAASSTPSSATAGGGGGGGGGSGPTRADTLQQAFFLTAVKAYLLGGNSATDIVPLPGQQHLQHLQQGVGGGGFLPSPTGSSHSSSSSTSSHSSSSSSAYAAFGALSTTHYTPPKADTLVAMATLLTQQLCDRKFWWVSAGGWRCDTAPPPTTSSSASGTTTTTTLPPPSTTDTSDYYPRGEPLWMRAVDYTTRTLSMPPPTFTIHPAAIAGLNAFRGAIPRHFLESGGGGGGSPGARRALLLPREAGGTGVATAAGMFIYPENLCFLHESLFHFLRVHLECAPLGGEEQFSGSRGGGGGHYPSSPRGLRATFTAVVDLWLMVLTPWRARARWKNHTQPPSGYSVWGMGPGGVGSGGRAMGKNEYHSGARDFRKFDYTGAFKRELERRAAGFSAGKGGGVECDEEDVTVNAPAVDVTPKGLAAIHRAIVQGGSGGGGGGGGSGASSSSVKFSAYLGGTQDFLPLIPPTTTATSAAPATAGAGPSTTTASAAAAAGQPTPIPSSSSSFIPSPASIAIAKAMVDDPVYSDPYNSPCPSPTLYFSPHWDSWVSMHYAFYTHLLEVFLKRLRSSTFPHPQSVFSGQPGIGPPGSPSMAPPHPILLECLERVLDVFSTPGLAEALGETAKVVGTTFASAAGAGAGAGAGGGVGGAKQAPGQPQQQGSPQPSSSHPPLGKRTLTPIGAQIHLLSHASLLCLPPGVSPTSIMPGTWPTPFAASAALDIQRTLSASVDTLLPLPLVPVPVGVPLLYPSERIVVVRGWPWRALEVLVALVWGVWGGGVWAWRLMRGGGGVKKEGEEEEEQRPSTTTTTTTPTFSRAFFAALQAPPPLDDLQKRVRVRVRRGIRVCANPQLLFNATVEFWMWAGEYLWYRALSLHALVLKRVWDIERVDPHLIPSQVAGGFVTGGGRGMNSLGGGEVATAEAVAEAAAEASSSSSSSSSSTSSNPAAPKQQPSSRASSGVSGPLFHRRPSNPHPGSIEARASHANRLAMASDRLALVFNIPLTLPRHVCVEPPPPTDWREWCQMTLVAGLVWLGVLSVGGGGVKVGGAWGAWVGGWVEFLGGGKKSGVGGGDGSPIPSEGGGDNGNGNGDAAAAAAAAAANTPFTWGTLTTPLLPNSWESAHLLNFYHFLAALLVPESPVVPLEPWVRWCSDVRCVGMGVACLAWVVGQDSKTTALVWVGVLVALAKVTLMVLTK